MIYLIINYIRSVSAPESKHGEDLKLTHTDYPEPNNSTYNQTHSS